MSGEELEALTRDVRANGLRVPITLLGGKVLDGLNRLKACEAAEVKPTFVEFEGGDPVAFVLSVNLTRRHLDASQRAAVAAKLANMQPVGRPSGNSANLHSMPVSEAAKSLNVSPRSVETAKKVLREASPEVVADVESGRTTVHAAAAALKAPKTHSEPSMGPKAPYEPNIDRFGHPIQEGVQSLWDEAEALGRDWMSQISKIRVAIEKGCEKGDRKFAELSNQTTAKLGDVYYALGTIRPFTVCPQCTGRKPLINDCQMCVNRGFLSKYRFESGAVLKKIREQWESPE